MSYDDLGFRASGLHPTPNSYDIDGVIWLNREILGVRPRRDDIIITGRSIEEAAETTRMLEDRSVWNEVFFNPTPFAQKSREGSGRHKATVINSLKQHGVTVRCHFEDDEVQAAVIRAQCPGVHVVMLVHDLTPKENIRHVYP